MLRAVITWMTSEMRDSSPLKFTCVNGYSG